MRGLQLWSFKYSRQQPAPFNVRYPHETPCSADELKLMEDSYQVLHPRCASRQFSLQPSMHHLCSHRIVCNPGCWQIVSVFSPVLPRSETRQVSSVCGVARMLLAKDDA